MSTVPRRSSSRRSSWNSLRVRATSSPSTWTRCLSILPASTCSLFYPLQPVFAALLGAVILKETFTSTFAIGLALISLDVVLSTWETKKLAEAKEQK